MGGGVVPPEGGAEVQPEAVAAGVPALTIEGGADFAEGDEPNFNREAAPQHVASSTNDRPDRGGDRGGRGGRPGGRPAGGASRRRGDGPGGPGGPGGGGGRPPKCLQEARARRGEGALCL